MPNRCLLIFNILILFLSCKQKPDYTKEIIGEWKFAKSIYKKQTTNGIAIPPPLNLREKIGGYQFLANNVCLNKAGYIDYNNRLYLGTKTTYKLDGDSLSICDLDTKLWKRFKILSLMGDTLKLNIDDKTQAIYVREHSKIDNNFLFDEVIVSASGCFGSCPINSILLDKNGSIVYNGEDHNTKEGYFTSKISNVRLKEIQLDFSKANIETLKEEYHAGWTDDETITLTFIKKGKIVKSISDYGAAAPAELNWAYTPVRYLYQQLKLDTLKNLTPEFDLYHFEFTYDNKIYVLKKSESFYLWNLLRQALKTQKPFHKQFDMKLQDAGEITKIETDGQLYQFTLRNGSKYTYNIGFNFINTNADVIKFRDKTEYD